MEEIIRPPAGKRKIHCKNEFELCYIRHKYFRKVKYNPTAKEMEPYRKVVRHIAQRTYYTYPKLFHIVGMTLDDVQAIGNVHVVNFIGLFEISPTKNVEKYENFLDALAERDVEITEEKLLGKNRANLTLFLKQRMEDLVRICKQKAKNIKGMRVDEYIPFYGDQTPPIELYKLLKDSGAYGFKRLDNAQFRAIRKKVKAKHGEPFQWGGRWYVSVLLEQRPLAIADLVGAGLDPYESEHNLNPEEILLRKHEEIRIDKQIKMFKNGSKEEKAKTILAFVEKNADNPKYQEEVITARKMLRTLGLADVR
jgi:hypothetical protein